MRRTKIGYEVKLRRNSIWKKINVILLFILSIGNPIKAQNILHECIDENSDGFCQSKITIYSDSTFIRSVGCERHQSIMLGKLTLIGDTILLQKCDLGLECFYSNFEFQLKPNQLHSDTTDIFYFDKWGNHSISFDNLIVQSDLAFEWKLNKQLNIDSIKKHNKCQPFSRSRDYLDSTNEFMPKNHPYFEVGDTYIDNAKQSISLILMDYYILTGNREYIEIPSGTSRINVIYNLYKEEIAPLLIYGVPLDHKSKPIIYNCNNLTYIIN